MLWVGALLFKCVESATLVTVSLTPPHKEAGRFPDVTRKKRGARSSRAGPCLSRPGVKVHLENYQQDPINQRTPFRCAGTGRCPRGTRSAVRPPKQRTNRIPTRQNDGEQEHAGPCIGSQHVIQTQSHVGGASRATSGARRVAHGCYFYSACLVVSPRWLVNVWALFGGTDLCTGYPTPCAVARLLERRPDAILWKECTRAVNARTAVQLMLLALSASLFAREHIDRPLTCATCVCGLCGGAVPRRRPCTARDCGRGGEGCGGARDQPH